MYSKIVHKLKHSIAVRLSILFTLLSALLLIALSSGVFFITSWQLRQEDIKSLNDFSLLMKSDLPKETNIPSLLNKHLSQELSAFHYHRYQIRLLAPHNALVFQSHDFPDFLLDDLERCPIAGLNEPLKEASYITDHSRYYIATVFQAHVGKNATKPVTVYITLNISQRITFLSRLKQALFWFVLLGSIVFSIASIMLIRRGLRPVWRFSRHIQSITIDNLQQHAMQAYWPDELNPLARSFDDLIARIQHGVNQLNHFSSDLAHELKTPITNLRIETEVLLEKERTASEYQASLRNNLEELERLSSMIERLLLLARMDNSAFTLSLSAVSLRSVLDKLLGYYDIMAQEKNITINTQGEATLVADRALIELVLSNVITNALKYTPNHGRIDIRIDSPSAHSVAVHIADTGPGIAEEHQAFIFDRFYRVDASRSQDIPGDGLGLAIVKAAMDAHHGRISVNSLPSHGTTFSLHFPS